MEQKLGNLMKQFRERRNISLKEAAGDAISPQNLSRFEKGTSMIKADTFFQVMANLSMDTTSFWSYYSPLSDVTRTWQDQMATQLKQGRYSKLIEKARQIPNDQTPLYHKQLLRVLYQTLALTHLASQNYLNPDDLEARRYVVTKMKALDIWTMTEYRLYASLLRQPKQYSFDLPFINQKEKEVRDLLKKSLTKTIVEARQTLFDVLLATVHYYHQQKKKRQGQSST